MYKIVFRPLFIFFFALFSILFWSNLFATGTESEGVVEGIEETHEEGDFDIVKLIFHHIGDDYYWHTFGHHSLPLPLILYVPNEGLKVFMSSKFHHGKSEYEGFRYDHGKIENVSGLKKATFFSIGSDNVYYDFSITKLVAALLFSFFLSIFVFFSVSKGYKKRTLKSPKGVQSFFEPIILFVRDDIVKPFLPAKSIDKLLPYFLTLFFFIWFSNMMGLVPIIGGTNLSGNIAFTATLAILTFIITNLSGKKPYWKHIFLPDVPFPLHFIIVPIEIAGILTKPFALLIRLFANISAGHIIIISIVSLIFILGKGSVVAGYSTSLLSIGFGLFLSGLEIVVAFIQAFIFTLLSALYIGQALQEHH